MIAYYLEFILEEYAVVPKMEYMLQAFALKDKTHHHQTAILPEKSLTVSVFARTIGSILLEILASAKILYNLSKVRRLNANFLED